MPQPRVPPEAPARCSGCSFRGGAELTPKAASDIKSLAATLKNSTDNVLVVGNADARGSKTVNNAMALARAKAVARILLGEGVSAERILVEGHGADEPVGTNNSTRGRGSNRRVDISVVPTGAASSGG
jgi:outer membrane protein OmpA-like peptidoglycan-associated protein